MIYYKNIFLNIGSLEGIFVLYGPTQPFLPRFSLCVWPAVKYYQICRNRRVYSIRVKTDLFQPFLFYFFRRIVIRIAALQGDCKAPQTLGVWRELSGGFEGTVIQQRSAKRL